MYLRKYRNPIPVAEYLPILQNVIGLLRSDFYNGKSGLDEPRDEERLAIYISELHRIYLVNLKEKLEVLDTIQKGFKVINDGIAPHAGKFREAGHLFSVVSALSHYTQISPELVQQVKKVFKPSTKPNIINGYLSVIRGQPVEAVKEQLQAMFNFLLNQEQVTEYQGLKDFVETVSVTPGIETHFGKELKQLTAKIDSQVATADLGVTLALVHLHGGVLSKLGASQVSKQLAQTLNTRAEEAAYTFSKEAYYRYFWVCQYSKSVSVKVIENYIATRTKDSSFEWGQKQLETLYTTFKDIQSEDAGFIRFKDEIETDIAMFQAQLDNVETRGKALLRV